MTADTGVEIRIEIEDGITTTLEHFRRLLVWLDRGRPRPLPINGREYARRQANRRKRR